jgi:hypothetical protein
VHAAAPASASCKATRCCPSARSSWKPIPHPRSLPPVPNAAIAGARVSFTAVPHGAAGRRPPSLAVVLARPAAGTRACSERQRMGAAQIRPTGTCKRKGFLSRVASAGACVVHSVRRRAAFGSSWLNAAGLPGMMLDVRALAAISSACCGRTADVARRGTASSVRVWRIQARPSWIDAVGCPVSSRAAGEAHLRVSGSAVTPPDEGSRATAPGRAVFWILAGRSRRCLTTSC